MKRNYGRSTSFEVDLIQVTDIQITPNKTFRYGQAPTINNFDVTFVYSDGSTLAEGDASFELTYDEEALKKFVMMSPGKTNVTITATNEDYDISFTKEVEVEVETPIGVEVTNPPKKTEYKVNETFDPTGLKVNLIYDNGNGKTAKVQIKNDALNFKVSTASAGEKNVSITTDIAGLDEILKDAKLKTPITVIGNGTETSASTSASSSTPSTSTPSGDFNALPIIIVAAVLVVAAGVVVAIVVIKKKKN